MVNDMLRPTAHWKKILATLEDSSWFINDKSQQPALNPRDVSTEPGWPVHAAVPATVDLAAVWPRSKETQVLSPTGKVVGKCGRDLILHQCHVYVCALRQADGKAHLKCKVEVALKQSQTFSEPPETSSEPRTGSRTSPEPAPELPRTSQNQPRLCTGTRTGSCTEFYLGWDP